LRNRLGKELVSYTDQDLIDYIEDRKMAFKKEHSSDDDLVADVGQVGIDSSEYREDGIADYVQHGEK